MRNYTVVLFLMLPLLTTTSVPVRGEALLSTWMGGEGADGLTSAAFLSDGRLVVGGSLADGNPAVGMLAIVDVAARKARHVQRLPKAVSDLIVHSRGRIVAIGEFGLAIADANVVGIQIMEGRGHSAARITHGPEDGFITLVGREITVHDAAGKPQHSWTGKGAHILDVEFDPATGYVFITGFNNHRGQFRGRRWPIQVMFVHAYNLKGELVWTAYDFSGQAVLDQVLEADTRGYRLAMGPEGKLYLAGESAGGATLWHRSSTDVSATIPFYKGDAYQNWFNTRANHITGVVRMDARTGTAENGTLILARVPGTHPPQGNTIRPRALAVGPDGRVYVAGAAASVPPVDKGVFWNEAEGGGAFFIALNPDFSRAHATKLAGGSAAAIALHPHAVAVVGDAKDGLRPVHAIQEQPSGLGDGWLVALRALGK